jgi:hypothetical protein
MTDDRTPTIKRFCNDLNSSSSSNDREALFL